MQGTYVNRAYLQIFYEPEELYFKCKERNDKKSREILCWKSWFL